MINTFLELDDSIKEQFCQEKRVCLNIKHTTYNLHFLTISQGRKDFIKRPENTEPEENAADNEAAAQEPIENIYETIEDPKEPETDLGEGQIKRARKKKLSVSQNIERRQ